MAKHPDHENVFCGCFGRCLLCEPYTEEEKAKLAEMKIDFQFVSTPRFFAISLVPDPFEELKMADIISMNSVKRS